MRPKSGSIFGREMALMMPAAAASALPSTNVQAMIRLTAMPISPATCGSNETARIAVPKRVR